MTTFTVEVVFTGLALFCLEEPNSTACKIESNPNLTGSWVYLINAAHEKCICDINLHGQHQVLIQAEADDINCAEIDGKVPPTCPNPKPPERCYGEAIPTTVIERTLRPGGSSVSFSIDSHGEQIVHADLSAIDPNRGICFADSDTNILPQGPIQKMNGFKRIGKFLDTIGLFRPARKKSFGWVTNLGELEGLASRNLHPELHRPDNPFSIDELAIAGVLLPVSELFSYDIIPIPIGDRRGKAVKWTMDGTEEAPTRFLPGRAMLRFRHSGLLLLGTCGDNGKLDNILFQFEPYDRKLNISISNAHSNPSHGTPRDFAWLYQAYDPDHRAAMCRTPIIKKGESSPGVLGSNTGCMPAIKP